MKKICVLLSALLSVSFFTYAQVDTRPFIFSVVPQISIPTGDFKKTNKLGFGGNFTGQITLTEKLKGLSRWEEASIVERNTNQVPDTLRIIPRYRPFT